MSDPNPSLRKLPRMPSRRMRWYALGAFGIALAGTALVTLFRLDRAVREAASEERWRRERVQPLAFRPLVPLALRSRVTGDGTVAAVTLAGDALVTAGGSGLAIGDRVVGVWSGLPSLRIAAAAAWQGDVVFALERGGWGRVRGSALEEATTGWGKLDVRALLVTPAGELYVGARQGLFLAAPNTADLERLDRESVRTLAPGKSGEILAGGETGLWAVAMDGAVRRIATPDPWIEDVGVEGDAIWAATPSGIASGRRRAEALVAHARGGDGTRGAVLRNGFAFVPAGERARVVTLGLDGSRAEETTPERFRRVFAVGGELLADGPSGLFRRDRERGWVAIRKREEGSLPLPHVQALAADGSSLWAGFFDGGLAHADAARSSPLVWHGVAESEAWGVNALLSAGGAVYAATLRGAFRVAPDRVTPIPGAGGAFSLASTADGIVVGYGQGVFLPGERLLSAFHGLPGNQAYALASSPGRGALWVGTPTGLGRIEGRRVTLRTYPGDGKLPHPWVTALVDLSSTETRREGLLVATYGGGVARHRGEGAGESWERFAETEGLKVNAGAMVVDRSGHVFIGTQGRGLWRSNAEETRFTRIDVPLPSPDVFSLALVSGAADEELFVGTSEGLARVSLRHDAPDDRLDGDTGSENR